MIIVWIKMKNRKYLTEHFLLPFEKKVGGGEIHMYMTTYFPDLTQALQEQVILVLLAWNSPVKIVNMYIL